MGEFVRAEMAVPAARRARGVFWRECYWYLGFFQLMRWIMDTSAISSSSLMRCFRRSCFSESDWRAGASSDIIPEVLIVSSVYIQGGGVSWLCQYESKGNN